ncbi:MAG: bestrophin family ion channel [Bacteroidota bacterium]
MFTYNPKDWWKLIFYFQKTDTFRKLLPAMLGVMAYTTVFYYIENEVLHLSAIKNPIAVHSLVGFVLSLLLVFRTNTSYDRWWEGRKLWGSFTNNSRNLALKINAFFPDNQEVKNFFRIQMSNYLTASKDRLRGNDSIAHLEFFDTYNAEFYKNSSHIPNAIFQTIYTKTTQLYKEGQITGDQLIVLNNELSSFTDNIGGCERIKNTPIPSSYNIFIKKMIFLYVFTMPFSFVIEFGHWAIPIVTLVFYAFAGIEMIAEEIEDPFGKDNNDLALDTIVKNVKTNLNEILG